jgi:RNA polymerase sigma factor (sigma-70 family)
MREANGIPKLTLEQEMQLTRCWKKKRSRKAADAIARANLRYVCQIAYKFRRSGQPLEDLVSEGSFGLLRALETYDPDREVRFITYAAPWVRRHIVDYVIKYKTLVPRNKGHAIVRVAHKVLRERAKVQSQLGDDAAAVEALVAKNVGRSPDFVRRVLAVADIKDVYCGEDLDLPWMRGNEPSPEELAIEAQELARTKGAVRKALKTLSAREADVATRFSDDEPRTLKEIGQQWGVCRERMRQIEKQVRDKLVLACG